MTKKTYTDGLLRAARLARNASRECRRRQRFTSRAKVASFLWHNSAVTALLLAQAIEREAKSTKPARRAPKPKRRADLGPVRTIAADGRVTPKLPKTWGRVK